VTTSRYDTKINTMNQPNAPHVPSPLLANTAWESLFRAQATVRRELTEDGAWGDLASSEYSVLYALSTGPSCGLRISDLQADVLLTQAGLSRLIARLEKRGLITRCPDPDDARARRIMLTASGREAQRRVGAAHARHVAAVMNRTLTRDQLRQLSELCRLFTDLVPEGENDD
jgi:DNA-binding MarR family transcriptional regulator